MTTGIAIGLGGLVGVSAFNTITGAKAQRESNNAQREALKQQRDELARQRKREEDQQRRENAQLMNSVSNLTNTSFSGVSSPSLDYDKYGDLG